MELPIRNHTKTPYIYIYIYLSEPGRATESPISPMPRRTCSYETFDRLNHHRSQDRLKIIPDNGMHGDLPRYSPRRPNGHDSLRAYRPQLYEEPVVRPAVHHQHRLQVKPELFNGENDWDQYISQFQNCADLGRWSECAGISCSTQV